MAQDDYYYEIQLTNKQLVFYFMAGAAVLILSFLVGVMVGRGVDASGGDVRASKATAEDRLVPEESASTHPQAPPTDNLTYAQRLESERVDDNMKSPASAPKEPQGGAASPSPKAPSSKVGAKGQPKASPSPESVPSPAAEGGAAEAQPSPATEPSPGVSPKPASGKGASPKPGPKQKPSSPPPASFTIQVGAFKDKSTADAMVGQLKAKGFAAYVVAPDGADGGLYNVRVGSYTTRADAEKTEARLRDDEKFKPFIVKN